MKKSFATLAAILITGSLILSSCSMRVFEGKSYVQGQHASKEGAKAQARASKQAKHFWF